MHPTRHHIKGIVIFALAILILIFAILKIREQEPIATPVPVQGDAAVRETATRFGTHLKEVPLLAEDTILKNSIEKAYKPYVTTELLATWLTNPKAAPGRITSSPWPDHIDILNVTPVENTYLVRGNIVLMTSVEQTQGGNAGTVPFEMTLIDAGDGWRISEYKEIKDPIDANTNKSGSVAITAKLNQKTNALGIAVTPLEVIEDSRCPINARCVWAGTLKIRTRLTSDATAPAAGTVVFTIGEPLVWNGYTITLTDTDRQKTTTEPAGGAYSYLYTI